LPPDTVFACGHTRHTWPALPCPWPLTRQLVAKTTSLECVVDSVASCRTHLLGHSESATSVSREQHGSLQHDSHRSPLALISSLIPPQSGSFMRHPHSHPHSRPTRIRTALGIAKSGGRWAMCECRTSLLSFCIPLLTLCKRPPPPLTPPTHPPTHLHPLTHPHHHPPSPLKGIPSPPTW
jgi:hypothetical protein